MSAIGSRHYDVGVIGAGPVGALTALAHAQLGARVALLEANPKASRRLAGEWLHPPALAALATLGIEPPGMERAYPTGLGFVVFPDNSRRPVLLPYPSGQPGLACDHADLVEVLREAAAAHPQVSYLPNARVRAIEGQRISFTRRRGSDFRTISAARIIGADGRASMVRETLGLSSAPLTCSMMFGLLLEGVSLPFEGYGHVLCGGPGPVLAYRLGPDQVRLIIDVPLDAWEPYERTAFLWEAYSPALPETLRRAYRAALLEGRFHGAANEVRPRISYGRPDRVLVGDAAGYYHPITAVGLTLGFGDALTLARCQEFSDYVKARERATRAPELLAMGLYEILADQRDEAVAIRHAVFAKWRRSAAVRRRTVGYLACLDTSVPRLALSFLSTVAHALVDGASRAVAGRGWRHISAMSGALIRRLGWLALGLWRQRHGTETGRREWSTRRALARALLVSMSPRRERDESEPADGASPTLARDAGSGPALERAITVLARRQGEEGGFEGEMIWCPMLAAQHVIAWHLLGSPIAEPRRRRLLVHFRETRDSDGLWGLHEHSEPYLFVTTLVYVAARLLGAKRSDPLLEPAAELFRREGGVSAIPSWGKLWLALLNLYEWEGVNPVLPELWRLPRWLPLHPARWYCHTRLIYMPMAILYARRYRAALTPLIGELREELYPGGYERVDFARCRNRLRPGDVCAPPGQFLRLAYRAAIGVERFHSPALRKRLLSELTSRIRFEIRSTDASCISPVSGLLNLIALWVADPDDPLLARARERFEGWIWEDEAGGARVTGARSASWDTAFALQALAASPQPVSRDCVTQAAGFLERQQIRDAPGGFASADRIDPRGGWCFAGAAHGWPVSDCTAEALIALIDTRGDAVSMTMCREGVGFMLRCQNADGGFGSYEPRRSRLGLEWMNPAEMFTGSMTERSYVECTASCLGALHRFARCFPGTDEGEVAGAMRRAGAWLRAAQRPDGSWRGVWGVQFIYGTLFGIRGLLAAGALPGDPAVRKACRWLLERQRADGGWGEHHSGCRIARYVEHATSQVIQTAWALSALLEAQEPDWGALERGACFLIEKQNGAGEWPRQDMTGVFFETALLDYTLYRSYFPVWALGLYESRRRERVALSASARGSEPAAVAGG